MKRIFLLLTICLMATLGISAQDMNIENCFSDDVLANKSVTAVKVKSDKLKSYNLSSFRSITISNNKRLASWVQRCVQYDAKQATGREEGIKNGKLQYGFYVFRRTKNYYKYIFFRNNKPESDAVTDVTLVYTEGKATFEELKQMFK